MLIVVLYWRVIFTCAPDNEYFRLAARCRHPCSIVFLRRQYFPECLSAPRYRYFNIPVLEVTIPIFAAGALLKCYLALSVCFAFFGYFYKPFENIIEFHDWIPGHNRLAYKCWSNFMNCPGTILRFNNFMLNSKSLVPKSFNLQQQFTNKYIDLIFLKKLSPSQRRFFLNFGTSIVIDGNFNIYSTPSWNITSGLLLKRSQSWNIEYHDPRKHSCCEFNRAAKKFSRHIN